MLTAAQTALARYCVAEMVRRRQLTGQPIPDAVRELQAALAAESVRGHQTDSDTTVSKPEDDPIDTTEAAAILGCSTRHIRRLTADLDGHRIADRWMFNRTTVTDYATAKGEHHGHH